MLQTVLTGLLYIITTILLIFFTNIGIVYCIVIPILYLFICASVYVIGYKRGIIDTREGLKDMVEKELKAFDAEMKRLSEGVDSGLL